MRDRMVRRLPEVRGRGFSWFHAFALVLMLLILSDAASPVVLRADEDQENVHGTAGYIACIEDAADILTDSEEEELYAVMLDGTEYGNMVFISTDDAEGHESKAYIERIYQSDSRFKGTNAVIYMIDMDNRMLWITGYGDNKKLVTADYANLITDNVYKYAKSGDYAACAVAGFQQINQRLAGRRVSGALRGVGNLCIAVIIAEILCFVIAYMSSASRKAGDDEILDNIEMITDIRNPGITHTGTRRIYDPPAKSSGSSGGSGGGGGSSGGGGGHGF